MYELLTGKRAFTGETPSETIAAVLEREPDWQALPAKTPAKIRELLRQCLQKDAGRRLGNIADARSTIEEVQRGWNRWRARRDCGRGAGAACRWRGSVAARPGASAGPLRVGSAHEVPRFGEPAGAFAGRPDGGVYSRQPTFFGPGQIYVKILPDGEPVQLTHDNADKNEPGVFTRRRAHRVYHVRWSRTLAGTPGWFPCWAASRSYG